MPSNVAPGVTLYQRVEMGWPATVYNSDGHTPRPKMAAPATWVTVHYTGANVDYGDPGDFVRECQELEDYAVNAGKSNEYNWVIGADGPEAACVATYAGDYQAAHSSGENAQAIGVLFLNGVGQVVTDTQVLAFRWLMDDLITRERIGSFTTTLPHQDMPGAATACPGDEVLARWYELLVPYDGGGDVMTVDYDQIEQRVRKVLDEGTGVGLTSWAATSQQTLSVAQQTYNETRSLQQLLKQGVALILGVLAGLVVARARRDG
jgi:hypothetical protein